MADSEESSSSDVDELDQDLKVTLLVHLTYHVPKLTQNGKPGRATIKDEKQKETTFRLSQDNYADFLRALLKPFGEEKYQVDASKPFRIKYGITG